MSIKRIMFSTEPQFNAEYIANVFWSKGIAKVSSITLIPYIIDDKIMHTAYVEVDSFCETEEGKNFIKAMTECDGMMFLHAAPEEENIWVFEPNTHYPGELCVGNFTTKFEAEFFASKEINSQQNEDDEESIDEIEQHTYNGVYYPDAMDMETLMKKNAECQSNKYLYEDDEETYCMNDEEAEEFERRYPIRGLNGTYYDVNSATEHIWVLEKDLCSTNDEAQISRIKKEITHLKAERYKCIIAERDELIKRIHETAPQDSW